MHPSDVARKPLLPHRQVEQWRAPKCELPPALPAQCADDVLNQQLQGAYGDGDGGVFGRRLVWLWVCRRCETNRMVEALAV